MRRDEGVVEKKKMKFMQHKSRVKYSQPLPRVFSMVCVGLGSFLGSPTATSLGTLR